MPAAPTADTEEKILISDTWVYDAAGNFEKGTLSVVQVKNGLYLLTVGASVEFLTDENTVYPVYIDPSLTISYGTTGSGYIEDVTVFEGIPNINCGTFLYSTVGYSEDYGRGRTAVRLNGLYNSSIYQTIIDSQITSVKFHVKEASGTDPQNILLYPLESKTWTESGATWNNIGAHSDVSVAEATLENNGLASFDITNLVSWDWKGNAANAQPARDFYQEQGFLMVSADETAVKQICSSEYTNTNLRPYVVMEYTAVLLIDGASSGVLCVEPSGKLQMSAKTYPSDCPVTWSVSDEDVATIDAETGLLTGVSCGQVTVTATAITEDNVTFSGTMRVYVVSVLPGEYHIEDPQQVDGFIESYNGIAQVMTGVSKESRWTVQYYSAGYYTIRSSETGRYLCADITNLSVMLNPASAAGMASRWQFSKTTTGEWIIAPILDSSLCLTADGYDVFLDEYDQASANAYGWIFRTTAFTLANYYDSSLIGQSELLEIIPDACLFVQRVFMDQFGITVNIKSEPVFYEGLEYETCESGDGEDCSECNYCNNVSPLQHHRNTDVIREQLYTETPREFNEVCVLWGHHEVAAFCGTEGGHSLLNIYGYARIGGPVIHIIKMAGSTMEAKKVNMAMTLLHEFVHTFGFSEVYGDYSDTHDDLSCVMGGDYSTQAFRESLYDWYMNDDGDEAIAPFCEECIQKLTGDGLANVYNKYHKEN